MNSTQEPKRSGNRTVNSAKTDWTSPGGLTDCAQAITFKSAAPSTTPSTAPCGNGTDATVTAVDTDRRELELQLTNGDQLVLNEEQLAQGDLRLAYVQHPFPAQGHTTDTTHVIIAGQVTREGTYVALTRAREPTHIYAAGISDIEGADRLQLLAERVSQTEPAVPSIKTPLAHEAAIAATTELNSAADWTGLVQSRIADERGTGVSVKEISSGIEPVASAEPLASGSWSSDADEMAVAPSAAPWLVDGPDQAEAPEHDQDLDNTPQRAWPRPKDREPLSPGHDVSRLERDDTPGWEP